MRLLPNFRMTCGNCFVWIDSNWSIPTIYASDFSQSTIRCCFEFLTIRKTPSLKQGLSTLAYEVSSLFCFSWKCFLKLQISSVPKTYSSAGKFGLNNIYIIDHINANEMQLFFLCSLFGVKNSTCFGRPLRPSSGTL